MGRPVEVQNLIDKMTHLDRIGSATQKLFEATVLEFEAHCTMQNSEKQEACREKLKTQIDIICDAKAEFQMCVRKLTKLGQDGMF